MSILNHVYTVASEYDGRDFFEPRNNNYFVLLIPFCKSIIFTCFCKVVCQVSSKIKKTHSYTQTIRERELYNFRCVNIRYNTCVCVFVCVFYFVIFVAR